MSICGVNKRNIKGFIFLSCLIIIIIINGCTQKKDIPIVYYKLVDSLNQVDKSQEKYLNEPHAPLLIGVDSLIYIGDNLNSRVICLDSRMNYLFEFGRKGNGPGEFSGIYSIKEKKNKIYILDKGNFRVSIFDKQGKLLNMLSLNSIVYDIAVTESGEIALLTASENMLIKIIDEKGNHVKSIGQLIYNEDSRYSSSISVAHLDIDEENNIYVAFVQSPMVRKYNYIGELLWEKDLNQIAELKKMFEKVEAKKKKDPSMKYNRINICYDSHCFNDKYYVGFIGVLPYGNTIYVFDKEGEIIKIIRTSEGNISVDKLLHGWDFTIFDVNEIWFGDNMNHAIYKYIGV